VLAWPGKMALRPSWRAMVATKLFAGNELHMISQRQKIRPVPFPSRILAQPLAQATGAPSPLGRILVVASAVYTPRGTSQSPTDVSYSFFLSQVAEQVFDRDLLKQVPAASWLNIPDSHFHAAPQASSELNRLLYLDVKMTLADNDVRKVRGLRDGWR